MQHWPGCPAKFYSVKRPVVVWQSINNAPSFDLTEYLGHLLFILFVGADVLIAVVSGHLKNYYSTQIKKISFNHRLINAILDNRVKFKGCRKVGIQIWIWRIHVSLLVVIVKLDFTYVRRSRFSDHDESCIP